MVRLAPVALSGGRITRRPGCAPAEAMARGPAGRLVRLDRSGGGSASAAAVSPPASRPCLDTGERAGSACPEGLAEARFHPGVFPNGTHARCQGPKIAEIMIAAGPTLTNSSATPIFNDGMICFRRVRPDDFPILERTGRPFLTRLFSCPPAGAPMGPVRQCRAAHRSSGLDDQAHADRCNARGGNPRRRTGW